MSCASPGAGLPSFSNVSVGFARAQRHAHRTQAAAAATRPDMAMNGPERFGVRIPCETVMYRVALLLAAVAPAVLAGVRFLHSVLIFYAMGCPAALHCPSPFLVSRDPSRLCGLVQSHPLPESCGAHALSNGTARREAYMQAYQTFCKVCARAGPILCRRCCLSVLQDPPALLSLAIAACSVFSCSCFIALKPVPPSPPLLASQCRRSLSRPRPC